MVLVTVDVKCCGSSSSPPFKNKIVSEARLKHVLSTHLTDICRYFFNKIKAKLNIFIERFNKVKKRCRCVQTCDGQRGSEPKE